MTRLIPLLLLSLTLIACRGGGLPGEPGPPVEEVYARIGDALIAGGDVAVVTEELVAGSGAASSQTKLMWLEVSTDRARIDTSTTYESLRSETRAVEIIARSMRHFFYEEARTRPVTLCGGVPSAVLALYTQCPARDDLTTTARQGAQFGGQPVIVLVTRGKFGGIDSIITIDERLYIDAETYLPLARVTKTNDSLGDTNSKYEVRFAHSFVDRNTLPADWFDPSAALTETIQLPISPP